MFFFSSTSLSGCECGICHLRVAPCLPADDWPRGGDLAVRHPPGGDGGSPGRSHGGAAYLHCPSSPRLHLPLHIQGSLLWVGTSTHTKHCHFIGVTKSNTLRLQTNLFSTLQDDARGAQGGVECSSHCGEESVTICQTDWLRSGLDGCGGWPCRLQVSTLWSHWWTSCWNMNASLLSVIVILLHLLLSGKSHLFSCN